MVKYVAITVRKTHDDYGMKGLCLVNCRYTNYNMLKTCGRSGLKIMKIDDLIQEELKDPEFAAAYRDEG